MIQITGLTKVYRRGRPPALLDLTFDARPGMVTALLGAEGAGKTTALRLMVELERGQGITLFDGRTYRRLRRPEREVGVLLPARRPVAGHPGRRARCHLRMLAGVVGVPATRADEVLEQTRLATVAEHRLRSFSPGMHRRLALAAALLGSPRTLLLDAPTEDLSPRNVEWFHSFLRSFTVAGGTVVVTTRTPQEASILADRVITLDRGRPMADQPVTEFRRARLHPEVAVRGPQMARLADLLLGQGAQVRRDGGAGIAVSGVGRTEIGELAYRHGILLHELADRVVEQQVSYPVLPAAHGRSGQVKIRTAEPTRPRPRAEPQDPDQDQDQQDQQDQQDRDQENQDQENQDQENQDQENQDQQDQHQPLPGTQRTEAPTATTTPPAQPTPPGRTLRALTLTTPQPRPDQPRPDRSTPDRPRPDQPSPAAEKSRRIPTNSPAPIPAPSPTHSPTHSPQPVVGPDLRSE